MVRKGRCRICESSAHVRGLCKRHYAQWYRGDSLGSRTRYDPNEFKVFGKTSHLLVTDIKGVVKPHKVLVDTADIPLLKPLKWNVRGNYVSAMYDGRKTQEKSGQIYLHRFLLDPPEEMDVDHVNGNPLDNRRKNLEIVTRAVNLQRGHKRNYGEELGIKFHEGPRARPWTATISTSFKTKEDAVAQRRIWEEGRRG